MGFLNPDKLIKEINLKPGMSVADFGCGSGEIALTAARQVGPQGQVIAIDILPFALQVLKRRSQEQGLGHIQTKQADLEQKNASQIENEAMDVVFLINILFQSKKKQAILEEAKRVLRSRGRLIIVDWLLEKKTFGPKAKYRLEPDKLKTQVKKMGFRFNRSLSPNALGSYHFGLVFEK